MPIKKEGILSAKGLRFGVVIARFNEFISNRLLSGCLDALTRHGAADEDIEIAWVPGSFEIPIARDTGVPVSLGIITADTLEQAINRAGAKAGNKGWFAALSAIEMADLYRKL